MLLRGRGSLTRGRFQFTVRLLLVLHLAVAGGLSALIYRIHKEREAARQLDALGWSLSNELRSPTWLWRIADKDRSQTVTGVSIWTTVFSGETKTFLPRAEDSLPWLRSLPNLKRLNLNEFGRPVDDTDEVINYLGRMLPGVSIESWHGGCSWPALGETRRLAALRNEQLRQAREQLRATRRNEQ